MFFSQLWKRARLFVCVCCSTKKFYLFCFHTLFSDLCGRWWWWWVYLCVFVLGGNMLKNVVVVAVVTLLITLTLRFLLCYVYVCEWVWGFVIVWVCVVVREKMAAFGVLWVSVSRVVLLFFRVVKVFFFHFFLFVLFVYHIYFLII